ncbi:alpha/beta family hydrolase [Undibacterium sp. TS12]|uniref:alpha/beta hydrolase family protein n=1 Tax=Undibacterium sp. TS12 TaxID=2908202 RepID=UPI001F4CF689|nr:alpha/beta family hydrolase [Undibacterium sp. TS12]MCH8618610.1 hypothetical protein [Undibacterium sp. TS12]
MPSNKNSIIARHMSLIVNTSPDAIKKIIRSDGRQLEVLVQIPPGQGPYPALILAPGLRYDLLRPVLAQLANYLLSQGFAVYRFNWAFYTTDALLGEPSPDLSTELDDIRMVLDMVRVEECVDQKRISVGGKSFGSIVAWRLFSEETDLYRCILLTPLCKASAGANQNEIPSEAKGHYPDLIKERRPVLMLAGDQDPYCDLPTLYRLASVATGKLSIVTLEGNHSFEMPASGQMEGIAMVKFERNINLLSRHVENFLMR